MSPSVTGERVVTSRGGFNPTWQRHVAAYALTARHLPSGRIVDLGCGVGHSFRLLAPRETVGVDVDPAALEGQGRETVAADMRRLPFGDGEFDGAVAVHSIEHLADPEAGMAEISRVVKGAGTAVLVTPNRLTFARPDEIVDPYHYVEFDSHELERLCRGAFGAVETAGVFGSDRYRAIVAREHEQLNRLLRVDPLRLRRLVPRRARQRLYNWRLSKERGQPDPEAAAIGPADFTLAHDRLEEALDVVAICREPRSARLRSTGQLDDR